MLSPLDLKNKMMEPKKRKYYDKDETDDYLELVMEQYKQLYDENLELQKNVKSLNDGVQYYRSIENTMQKALSGLEQEGLLYTKRTSGRFITNDQARIEALRIQVVTDSVRAWVREMRAYGVDDEMLEELVRKELKTHETD